MNETVQKFLETMNVDIEKFNLLEESQIKNDKDVNAIISRFSFFKPKKENKKISIADVVGYDYGWRSLEGGSIINNLSGFFDKNGDSYHSRSVSMLDIPQGEVIKQLEYSFKKEPICLIEVDSGKYIIGNNGMHRFHVIKMHYLNELSKLNPHDTASIKKLREKYSFNSNVSEVDFVKTYSAFMLSLLDQNLKLESHYNKDWQLTDKVNLINFQNSDEKIILTNDQLIEMVNKKMKQFLKTASRKERGQFNDKIKTAYENFDSFKAFYDYSLKQIEKEGSEWNF